MAYLRVRAIRSHSHRIAWLRRRGVTIGEGCVVLNREFSTEPYLVELCDHVAVAGGVCFLAHDGAVWGMRHQRPALQHFGRIRVGSDTFVGQNAIVLPGTEIGRNCIIGAGTVVRGKIPDNSLVVGNPGKVVGRASMLLEMMAASDDSFDSFTMTYAEREALLRKHFGLGPPRNGG